MNEFEPARLHQTVAANLAKLQQRIAEACERSDRDAAEIKIVAVAKNFPSQSVRIACQCGINNFGENRIQEALSKYAELEDIRHQFSLHFIGHLQTNKMKNALELFDIIQSVDSTRLAQSLNERATRPLNVLLQVNVVGESTKYGIPYEEMDNTLKNITRLPNIEINGFMAIAPQVNDPEDARPVFRKMKNLKETYGFRELSMGMTDDFEVAIEEGSTMVRIGRAIFGERR